MAALPRSTGRSDRTVFRPDYPVIATLEAIRFRAIAITLATAPITSQPSSVPTATADAFVQHLVDGWYCTGRRAEGDIDLASFAAEVVQQWQATEIRLSGGRGSDQLASTVARATGVPVRSTAASDGTAGVALLAQYPDHWLEAARRVPVIAEARPGGAH